MKKSNPSVYPITAGFEEQLILMKILVKQEGSDEWVFTSDENPAAEDCYMVAETMHETLGEYEHGTADPEELIGAFTTSPPIADPEAQVDEFRKQALITLRNIYIDLLLTMGSK